MVIFLNRIDAGRRLAKKLSTYAGLDDVIVLAIPRGGVPIGFEVASELRVPLDVFVVRKLGVPGHEELAFGAIASRGIRILDAEIVESMGISELDIELITEKETAELDRRERVYRGARAPLNLKGRTVILVDDGIATGASTLAAIAALRQLNPARIVLGVPVAPASTCRRLRTKVDELICLEMPESFFAIGQFYEDFSQISDEEVKSLMLLNAQQRAPKIAAITPGIRKGAHS